MSGWQAVSPHFKYLELRTMESSPQMCTCLDWLGRQGPEIVENSVGAVKRVRITQVYAKCLEHGGSKGWRG